MFGRPGDVSVVHPMPRVAGCDPWIAFEAPPRVAGVAVFPDMAAPARGRFHFLEIVPHENISKADSLQEVPARLA